MASCVAPVRVLVSTGTADADRYVRIGGEEKANRNNGQFKNRRNVMKTSDMPKVNRDRNTTLLVFASVVEINALTLGVRSEGANGYKM
jgi:hypothetical protein